MCKKIKKLSKTQLTEISKFSYEKLAFEITKLFIGTNEIDQSFYKKFVNKLTVNVSEKKLFL